jgi:hypothetical protein
MKPIETFQIHPGFVVAAHNLVFATPRDRCLYLGTADRRKPQWLLDHPDAWRRIEDVLREAASLQRRVECPVENMPARPSSRVPSDIRKDVEDVDDSDSVDIPPQAPALVMKRPNTADAPSAPGYADEITIRGVQYISAALLISRRGGFAPRTLSRLIAAGETPPYIRIGRKLYFEAATVQDSRIRPIDQVAPH